jgi:hypothetical protein
MSPSRPEKCLKCGSVQVAAIIYDSPASGKALQDDLKYHRAIPAGRAPSGNDPHWRCLKCGFEWGHPRGLSGASTGVDDIA